MFGVMMFITTAVQVVLMMLLREMFITMFIFVLVSRTKFLAPKGFGAKNSLDVVATTMRMRSRDALPTRHAGASRFALGMLVAATVVTQVCMLSRRCLSTAQPSSQRP